MHVPSTSIHIFSMGEHCAHWTVAVMARDRLTVMMTNQTKTLVQPWVMRSNVMANDVLLQHAARMVAKPAALEMRSKRENDASSMSALCFPNPMLTQRDCRAEETARATWSCQSMIQVPSRPRGKTYPAECQQIVVPPHGSIPPYLAVDSKAEEDSRNTRQEPDGHVELRAIVILDPPHQFLCSPQYDSHGECSSDSASGGETDTKVSLGSPSSLPVPGGGVGVLLLPAGVGSRGCCRCCRVEGVKRPNVESEVGTDERGL